MVRRAKLDYLICKIFSCERELKGEIVQRNKNSSAILGYEGMGVVDSGSKLFDFGPGFARAND